MLFKDLSIEDKQELEAAGLYGPAGRFKPMDTIPEVIVKKRNLQPPSQKAQTFREDRAKELTGHQEGGLFRYEMKANKGDQEEVSSFTRLKPLSQQDKDFLKNTMGKYLGTEDVDFKETLKDDPQGVFDYVMSEGLMDLPKGTTYEEAMQAFGKTPTQFREIALGREPSVLGATTDTMSEFGRKAMAGARAWGQGYDPREAGRLTSDAKVGALHPMRIAGDMARSGTAPLSMMASGLAPAQATLKGIGLREGLLGIGEGVGETYLAGKQGLVDPGLGDYALGGALGGALGAGIPLGIEGTKKGFQKLKSLSMNKEGPTLRQKYYDAKQSVADSDIIGMGMDPTKVQAEGIIKGRAGTPYEKGGVKTYAELMGENPNDLYPGLGMKYRANQNLLDLRNLATRNPDVHGKWMNTYDKLLQGIDQYTNYSNAPTLEEAGGLMRTSTQKARDELFKQNADTYRNVLGDPQYGPLIDQAYDKPTIRKSLMKVNELIDKYQKRVPQGLKATGEVDLEGNPIYTIGDSRISEAQYSRLQSAIVELKRAKEIMLGRELIPGGQEVSPGGGTVLEQLNKARYTIQDNLKSTSPLEKTPIQDELSKDIRNLFREDILGAVKKAAPDKYQDLLGTNEAIDSFNKDMDLLKKDLGSETRSDKQVAAAILDNNRKLTSLNSIMSGYGQGKEFEQLRDAWFKHKVMKQSAATGDLSNKVAKPLEASKPFIKGFYADVPYDQLEKFAKGLIMIGDPQLIGLAGALNEASKKTVVPTSASEAKKLMVDMFGPDQRTTRDTEMLANILRGQQDAIIADYGKRMVAPKGKLGDLVRRLDLSTPRALYGVSENEQAQPENKRNLWEVLSR